MHNCSSGRHWWGTASSAERCCNPLWRRELRLGPNDREPGDAADDVTMSRLAGGCVYVWHYVGPPVGKNIV